MKRSRLPLLLLALLAVLALGAPALEAVEPLTLRINDTAGVAGELVAVTLRTYASRPVHQGQICFRSQFLEGPELPEGAQPFSAFVETVVFSAEGDATSSGGFDPTTQTLDVDLFSASATINSVDGPLAVFFFKLASGLTPGDEFNLQLDPANTFLLDANDNPIPIDIRGGTLTVLAEGAPRSLEAEGTEAAPGTLVRLAAATSSTFPLSQGQAGFRFDPAVVDHVIDASIDPRYGTATVFLAEPEPGLAVVSFRSSDNSVNRIPGAFLHLRARLVDGVAVGTQSVLSLDPQHTFLIDAAGDAVPLVLEGDLIEIVAPNEIFVDGFESGDVASWTIAVP